ncbi:hypothetical protein V7S43_007621 [Phytophthora oleae]|uniref:Uncharacterized protein n=1 Tax=Phytophthora oleae TaxID=2107226 RepID=A0ABD3FKG1_9STRA
MISEENLQDLGQLDVEQELPSIPVTDDEIDELRGQNRPEFNREDESTNLSDVGGCAATEATQATAPEIAPIIDEKRSKDITRSQYVRGDKLQCAGSLPP